ncbi:hypothetical protein G9A89_021524 [Geosiphon pyriformis]|nr:hypothetical protein G9A89_021524 [Geosiphon pyriformis]
MDKLAINTFKSTKKKKKTKVDFILNPNKVSTSTANNNEPPKAKPISLIPREKLREVQKFFESKPSKIQLLTIKQKKLSLEEKKIDIENLLAKNSPVISKESDTSG